MLINNLVICIEMETSKKIISNKFFPEKVNFVAKASKIKIKKVIEMNYEL